MLFPFLYQDATKEIEQKLKVEPILSIQHLYPIAHLVLFEDSSAVITTQPEYRGKYVVCLLPKKHVQMVLPENPLLFNLCDDHKLRLFAALHKSKILDIPQRDAKYLYKKIAKMV